MQRDCYDARTLGRLPDSVAADVAATTVAAVAPASGWPFTSRDDGRDAAHLPALSEVVQEAASSARLAMTRRLQLEGWGVTVRGYVVGGELQRHKVVRVVLAQQVVTTASKQANKQTNKQTKVVIISLR